MKEVCFSDIFHEKDIKRYLDISMSAVENDVERILNKDIINFNDFLILLSPKASDYLEEIAQKAHKITIQRFGKVVQLYIPLYLSNVCYNLCKYCGYRSDKKITRYTLSIDEVLKETEDIKKMGFSHILLVSGSAPDEVNMNYLKTVIKELSKNFASIILEIYTLSEDQYRELLEIGAEGITVYQEIYNKKLYKKYHLQGSKKDYKWRLNTPDRAGKAGLRKINIGSLLGLGDWRYESISLALHCDYLLKYYWKSQLSLSFPRITNTPADFFYTPVADKELVQMIIAFRLLIPDLNLVISTREKADFRMNLIRLGITQISAGSKTTPGGYAVTRDTKDEQFSIEDTRIPCEVAEEIKNMGYEPVWKDWDQILSTV